MKYEEIAKYDEKKYLRLWKRFGVRGMKIANGARVAPTDWAIQNGVISPNDRKVYIKVRDCRAPYTIMVLRGFNKQPTPFWSGFWKIAPAKE